MSSSDIRSRGFALLLLAGCCVTGHGGLLASDSGTVDTTRGPMICIVSDTQTPIVVERLFLRAKNNRGATAAIFRELARLHPTALVHLGDVVPFGFSDSEWANMDSLLRPLRESGVPVPAILGNHDLMLLPEVGQANFQARFPEHVPTGYVRVVDSVAFVLLNSNFGKLEEEDQARQLIWYDSALISLERDDAVVAVVVGCHHSPYSNSRIEPASEEVQAYFVPQFLRAPKCRLFVSGHSHTFEHFRKEGKDFLVLGGGGGLQHPLYEGEERPYDDLSGPPPKPMFHFLTLERSQDALTAVSHRLEEDFTTFREYYRLVIPIRPSTARP